MRQPGKGSLDPQGPAAETMAHLWWFMLWLGIVVFVVVFLVLLVGLFRPRNEDHAEQATPNISDRWFAAGGLVVPALIVLAVFAATIVAMRAVPDAAPPQALSVEIVGHQWWWEVRYPDAGVTTANELHIPVGRPVAVRLASSDVIHSFWVPRLGGKMDMLPDGPNTLVLEADAPGIHKSQCAEFCGLAHADMALTVVAEPQERFESWLAARRRPAPPPTAAGARLGLGVFIAEDCVECHSVSGSTTGGAEGPDLTHFGSRPMLGAGVAPNTPVNLARWITDPHDLKPGVKMPATKLPERELDALVDYLGSLE